jgi:solute carrier family 35 protein
MNVSGMSSSNKRGRAPSLDPEAGAGSSGSDAVTNGSALVGTTPAPTATSSSSASNNNNNHNSHTSHSQIHSQATKILSAVFYGVSSILVIFTNKAVMTNFHFHHFDFLATIQFVVTTVILMMLIILRKIDVPMLSWSICKEILPVSLMFLGNVLCGLGSTKSLNIPMFTALRRFSIFMTMVGEWYLLKSKPSTPIVLSVMMMVGGSLIAAMYDLAFDLEGYTLVFLNNIFTALNGVYMKKASVSGKCSKMGVLFYNSLFSGMIMMFYFFGEHLYLNGSLFPSDMMTMSSGGSSGGVGSASSSMIGGDGHTLLSKDQRIATEQVALHALAVAAGGVTAAGGAAASAAAAAIGAIPSNIMSPPVLSTLSKVYSFAGWSDPTFLMMFFGAASMGSVLNYSIFLCTTINSPLTTAVVGATKNVATTYIGMFAFPDYTFSWINFLGINVSIMGSLYYTYMILFKGASGFGGA